jgi:hypothetical protein
VRRLKRSRKAVGELADLVHDGNRLTWAQSITRPMRINLTFDLTVDGDQLTGTAKAGRLPGSKVVGHRIPPRPSSPI